MTERGRVGWREGVCGRKRQEGGGRERMKGGGKDLLCIITTGEWN